MPVASAFMEYAYKLLVPEFITFSLKQFKYNTDIFKNQMIRTYTVIDVLYTNEDTVDNIKHLIYAKIFYIDIGSAHQCPPFYKDMLNDYR